MRQQRARGVFDPPFGNGRAASAMQYAADAPYHAGLHRVRFDGDHSGRLVPHAYLDAGHLDHAYAMTVHKAQGLTCDRAYVLCSAELYAEAGYTALSRGRLENHLYTTIDEPDIDHHGALTDDPLHQIHAALARSQREHLATRQAAVLPPAAGHPRSGVERDTGIDLGR